MVRRHAIVPAVFLVVAISAVASAAWAADSVVGTWRMVSWTEEVTESKAVRTVFGEHPNGLLTLTADGRMAAVVTDPNRKAPAQTKITDAEAVQLFQTMNAYAGTYKIEGDKLIIHREIDARGPYVGADQVRFFKVDGDRLQYKSTPFVSSWDGKEIISSVVWDRVK